MITLEAARERLLAASTALEPEFVETAKANGRTLAADIVACGDLPAFDSSAMDGYAVRSADSGLGIRLKVVGVAAAGTVYPSRVNARHCVRVYTGSPLPDGTDAVVMQEDMRLINSENEVEITNAPKPWENVRFQGEDVRAGNCVLLAGQRLFPQSLGLLAALGIAVVNVVRRPKVVILPNGSELVAPGAARLPGQIFESNATMLAALIEAQGFPVEVMLPPCDELAEIQQTLRAAFDGGDVVISVGGASVGDLDLIRLALHNLGGQTEFWKLAIRPGKPFFFGTLGKKRLFGLPGNPVSAFVTCVLLVLPALRKMGADPAPIPRFTYETLGEDLSNSETRRHFVRVRTELDGLLRVNGSQASHLMHGLATADGLVDVPPGTVLAAGTRVPVIRW